MKLTCLQENLNRALTIVGRAVPGGKALDPALQTVLLSANENGFQLEGMDMTLSLQVQLDAQVQEVGEVAVSHRRLSELVSTLGRDAVYLELVKEGLSVRCGKSRVRLATVSPDSFPRLPASEYEATLFLPAGELRQALGIAFAAAADTSRLVLAGINFDLRDGAIVFAASNGFQLAVREMKTEVPVIASYIIPKTSLSVVQQVLVDPEETVMLQVSKGRVTFQVGAVRASTLLLNGVYPNYENFIPKEHFCYIAAPREELMRTVRSASVLSSGEHKTVKLMAGSDGVHVVSRTAEVGDFESLLDAEVTEEGEVSINAEQMIDALQSMQSETVTIGITSKSNPITVQGDEGYRVVLMPVITG